MAKLSIKDLPEQAYGDLLARFVNTLLMAMGLRDEESNRTQTAAAIAKIFGKDLEHDPGKVLRRCVQAGMSIFGNSFQDMIKANGAKAWYLGDKTNIDRLYGTIGHSMQKKCLRSMSLAQALRKAKGLTKLEAIPPSSFKRSMKVRS